MKKIYITFLSLMAITVTFYACQQLNGKENKNTKAPVLDESAISVKLSAVEKKEVSLPVVSSGLITTSTEAKLSFKIGGFVNRLFVKEGETVKKGQLMATLNMTEINAQVVQAKNGVEKSKRDFDRVQRLYRDSAATLEQVQNVQTAYEINQEAYNIASFNQQHASIYATASGKVIRKLVNEGEFINAGTTVYFINAANENNWIIRAGLPDIDWVRTKPGDRAIVTIDAYPDHSFDAEVTLVGEGADPLNGLYTIEIKIKPAGKKLASGLFGKVQVFPGEKRLLKSIPVEALVEGNGKNAFVFVATGNKVRKLPVRIAFINEDNVFIAEGLDTVETVISAGSAFLTEYSSVTITQ
jgi:multidrug efflux system membrane fusion protein